MKRTATIVSTTQPEPVSVTDRAARIVELVASWARQINAPPSGQVVFDFGDQSVRIKVLDVKVLAQGA